MKQTSFLTLCLFLPRLAGGQLYSQSPLTYPWSQSTSSDKYEFQWPIRKVAVIGAGVGGLIAYRELDDAGFDTHLYERDDAAGGNWHYSDQIPIDTPIPSQQDVSRGDYTPWLPPKGALLPYVKEYRDHKEGEFIQRSHRAPKPIWKSLTSNAPAPIQQVRELPWPVGTPWALPNQKLQRYLRAFATWHGVGASDNNPKAFYNTRLELVDKHFDRDGQRSGWDLTFSHVEKVAGSDTIRVTWTQKHFDGVIIATGRYNSPNVPKIEGVAEWAKRFPSRLRHSRQYRVPEAYANQTVLIIGASTSGGEISRDVITNVKAAYVSVRPSDSPLAERPTAAFLSRIPDNATIIPEIGRFLPPTSDEINEARIELKNGTILSGFDHVIFATGYRFTYPFLPQLHNPSLGYEDHAAPDDIQPIVTDGTHLRSLYLDSFYIPDPTLTFINANYGMQSFTYAEFVSLAIAKVWSGTADFPTESELWKLYRKLYDARGGYSKNYQFLSAQGAKEHLRFFQGWLNDAAVKYGGKQIDGLSKDNVEISAAWSRARFNRAGNIGINAHVKFADVLGQVHIANLTQELTHVQGTEDWVQDLVFPDAW